MRLLATLFRRYTGKSTAMLIALMLAGLAEGVGISAFLPLLNLAIYKDVSGAAIPEQTSELEHLVDRLLSI